MENTAHVNIKEWQTKYANPEVQIEELFRNYNISTELIKRTTNYQEFLDMVLDEYINRFDEIPGVDFVNNEDLNNKVPTKEKLRSLVLFATQAVLLKENAQIFQELEKSNQQLKDTTNKLDQKNKKLEQMNHQYLNMLSFVSHELRSPLISVLGFAELLDDGTLGSLSEEQRKAVRVIIRSSNTLLDMIQNYLDLAKIEQGEMQLEKHAVNLYHDVISNVLEEMKEQFHKKELGVHVEGDLQSSSVYADTRLLRVVIINLLSNAVKYGERKGEVFIELDKSEEDLQVAVTNTGEGIAKKDCHRVFQKFSQVEQNHGKEIRSSGLGLFNSKYIIKKHGGKIWADSKKGEWFKVIFTLPIEQS